jgi:hypothetical protein
VILLDDMIFPLISSWVIYLKYKNKLLAKLLFDMSSPPKSYDEVLKTSYTYVVCFCIELCQILMTL